MKSYMRTGIYNNNQLNKSRRQRINVHSAATACSLITSGCVAIATQQPDVMYRHIPNAMYSL